MTDKSKHKGYVIAITHFEGDADRVAVPLVLANGALAMGKDVLIWVTLEAVQLAKRQAANHLSPKSFPKIQELLESFRELGGKIGVCPPCAKTHGVTDADLVANASWMGGAAVLEQSQYRETIWF